MKIYTEIMNRLYRALLVVSGACIATMVLIITFQVLSRTLAGRTPRWSEEFTISVLFLYAGFLGAAPAYRDRMHIGITILLMRMGAGLRGGFYRVIDGTVGLFAGAMVMYGGMLAWRFRGQILPATGISVGLSYLPVSLSGLVLLLFVVEKLMGDPGGAGGDGGAGGEGGGGGAGGARSFNASSGADGGDGEGGGRG